MDDERDLAVVAEHRRVHRAPEPLFLAPVGAKRPHPLHRHAIRRAPLHHPMQRDP
jgi:hypothetical protein